MKSKITKVLEESGFWEQQCIHSGVHGVEQEHAIFYSGRQVDEVWAVVPCSYDYNRNPSAEIKAKSSYVAMLQCKSLGEWEEMKEKYNKRDWDREFNLLHEKYKDWDFFKTDILND